MSAEKWFLGEENTQEEELEEHQIRGGRRFLLLDCRTKAHGLHERTDFSQTPVAACSVSQQTATRSSAGPTPPGSQPGQT